MPPNALVMKEGGHVLRTQGDTKQEISKLCYQMAAEQQGSELGKYFMLKAQLMQIILLILRQMEPVREKQKSCNFESYSRQYVVKKIVSYLNENYYTFQKDGLDIEYNNINKTNTDNNYLFFITTQF